MMIKKVYCNRQDDEVEIINGICELVDVCKKWEKWWENCKYGKKESRNIKNYREWKREVK